MIELPSFSDGTMSSLSPATPARASEPKVEHNFDGESRILHTSYQGRGEVRNALKNLQQALAKVEGVQVQVYADVKLRIAGVEAKEHTYTVTVNDPAWDANAFSRQVHPAHRSNSAPTNVGATGSSLGVQMNGQQTTGSHSVVGDGDDAVDIRPPKRARTDTDDRGSQSSSDLTTQRLVREALSLLQQRSSNDPLDFLKKWHSEWIKQGGWLFDTLNKAVSIPEQNTTNIMTRLSAIQDVLGQAINTSSASTMAELGNIAKLAPWLESCRKANADKVQAREEKWRSSSATFHDQSRRDRESAERRLEVELTKQRALLVKIAEVNGVDVDDDDDETHDGRGAREESLGAQLTAELNHEAMKGQKARRTLDERRQSAYNIDDDDR